MPSLLKTIPTFKDTVHNFYSTWPLNAMAAGHNFNSQLLRRSQKIYLFYFLSITNLAFLLSPPHTLPLSLVSRGNYTKCLPAADDLNNPLGSVFRQLLP